MVGMNEQISRLMDGELDDEEVNGLIVELRDLDAQREWQAYHLIGDALRDTEPVSDDFMMRFSARLAEEPTVLAPHRLPKRSPVTMALSAAASVAAVGLVVWTVLQTGAVQSPAELVVAKGPSAELANAELASVDVNPYLIAHQEYSPSVGMQGVSPYIRTVSETREVNAR